MTAKDIRKNFAASVDGRGYVGQVDEFNPPKLVKKAEEYRAGGMNAPVKLNLGMEAMDCDLTLKQFSKDVIALYGLSEGQFTPVTLREVLESYDGTVTTVIHTMRGTVTEMDMGTAKAGEPGTLKASFNLNYYKLQHGGTVIQEIDIPNMVHIVNGVDQLAKQREALGM